MYNVEVVGDKLKAWVDYGDDFPFSVALYDDDAGTIPTDLTGKDFVLGIESTNGTSLLEVDGVKSSNEVLFSINYADYSSVIKEGQKVKFDYWDKTNRMTEIPKSDLEFRSVAHITEV